jgi:hypothetical protein
MAESYIMVAEGSFVRIELCALTPTGPYRLIVDHSDPAENTPRSSQPFVEYFDTAVEAVLRRAEIETALVDRAMWDPTADPRVH